MELYFVNRAALAALPEQVSELVDVRELGAKMDRAAVPERMPFLIGDDGLPATAVNDLAGSTGRCYGPVMVTG